MEDRNTDPRTDATPSVTGFDNRKNDHIQRRDCLHAAGDYYVVICANGAKQIKLLCTACHKNMLEAGVSIPHSAVRAIDNLPVIADLRHPEHPCTRCGAPETEEHHWAPRSLFDDWDEWPTDWLCVPCHVRWHNVVRRQQAA